MYVSKGSSIIRVDIDRKICWQEQKRKKNLILFFVVSAFVNRCAKAHGLSLSKVNAVNTINKRCNDQYTRDRPAKPPKGSKARRRLSHNVEEQKSKEDAKLLSESQPAETLQNKLCGESDFFTSEIRPLSPNTPQAVSSPKFLSPKIPSTRKSSTKVTSPLRSPTKTPSSR